LTPKQTKKYRN